jgi:hypothetical protein
MAAIVAIGKRQFAKGIDLQSTGFRGRLAKIGGM